MLKLQQMIKWDVFLEHGVEIMAVCALSVAENVNRSFKFSVYMSVHLSVFVCTKFSTL